MRYWGGADEGELSIPVVELLEVSRATIAAAAGNQD